MADRSQSQSHREIRFYRVILEEIDPRKETRESFAIKLALQTRTPVTRINAVVRNLPYPVKSGLNLSQANKFSAVLEELGGKVSISAYTVRPGKEDEVPGTRWKRTGLQSTDANLTVEALGELQEEGEKGLVCANCGWENKDTSEYCIFCYEKFKRDRLTMADLHARVPEENPLSEYNQSVIDDLTVSSTSSTQKLIVFAGLILILLIIIILRT